jgi:hypothetical protein
VERIERAELSMDLLAWKRFKKTIAV